MANKTFTTMKSNVGSEVMDTSTAFATIIGRFLNRRYFQILRSINWKQINSAHTITLASGTQNYVLPNDFYKEVFVQDVTNNVGIEVVELDELYRYYGDSIADSGSVSRCCIYEDAVIAQPTSASKLAITSSSAADTTQTIQIRGIASGVEVYETQTLNGTAAVASTNSYTRITGISFSAVRAGTITITSNSAAVTNATIPLEMLDVRYKLMKFHYVPTAVATINVPYYIKPFPLSQDYDYPLIDIADLIEIGAIADAWKYKRQLAKAQMYELMFVQGLSDYIFDQENQNKVQQFQPATFDRGDLY
jgi:hypothetical protein